METRTLGKAGPELSVVGLGCNNFGMAIDRRQASTVVHAALDAGVTHFDTAEMRMHLKNSPCFRNWQRVFQMHPTAAASRRRCSAPPSGPGATRR